MNVQAIRAVSILLIACLLSACRFTSMIGNFPVFGWVVNPSPTCTEYEQVKTNAEFVITAAKELQAGGKITYTKLMEIDQDAGLYSSRMKQLCEFFDGDKIKFDEYQTGIEKATADYMKLRALVFELQRS